MDVIALGGIAVVAVLCLPIVRAVARRVERKGAAAEPASAVRMSAADAQIRTDVDELRAQVTAMGELRDRVLELEERVDFAERMLTRERDAGRLQKPS